LSKKKELRKWIKEREELIEQGGMVVLFLDECHLLWGDICGYVWGRTDIRIEIPVKNQKERKTYYGALNCLTGKIVIKGYEQGNTKSTINFIKELREFYSGVQLAIVWDGASYHRSQEFKSFLEEVNKGKEEAEWPVTCIRFAPNAPEQNPIEDVWLQGKEFLRSLWHKCKNFGVVKWLFEWFISEEIFDFPKLSMYRRPS